MGSTGFGTRVLKPESSALESCSSHYIESE
jgi:hypothetical protein